MNKILIFCTVVLWCSLPAFFAHAQSQVQTLDDLMADSPNSQPIRKSNVGSIRIFDSRLIHPMPDWLPQEIKANPMSLTRVSRQEGKNTFQIQMVPKEESITEWRNLFAIMGLQNYGGTNATHARDIVRGFRVGCKPSNLNVRPLQGNPKIALLVVICGSFAREPEIGEVGVFVLLQRGKTAVRLYREWRGPAFRSEDPSQWLVTTRSLDRIIKAMTRARLLPLNNPIKP